MRPGRLELINPNSPARRRDKKCRILFEKLILSVKAIQPQLKIAMADVMLGKVE
jgi:hypothetical protein